MPSAPRSPRIPAQVRGDALGWNSLHGARCIFVGTLNWDDESVLGIPGDGRGCGEKPEPGMGSPRPGSPGAWFSRGGSIPGARARLSREQLRPSSPVVPTAVPRVPPGYRFFKPGGLFGMKPPEEPFGAARTGPEESKALGSPCTGESGSVGNMGWDSSGAS